MDVFQHVKNIKCIQMYDIYKLILLDWIFFCCANGICVHTIKLSVESALQRMYFDENMLCMSQIVSQGLTVAGET